MESTTTGTETDAEPLRPNVVATPGTLPVFPNRSATFVANLLGLFFGDEDKTRMLDEALGELDSYGGRLLPVVNLLFPGRAGNLLVLEREPDPALTQYLHEDAGLALPEWMVLPHPEYLALGRALFADEPEASPVIDRLAAHPSGWMDGYVTDETLAALAVRTGKRTLSTIEGSRRGNDKLRLYQFLAEAGLPMIPTETAADPEDVERCLARISAAGFDAAVVKAAMGASGIGMIRIDDVHGSRKTGEPAVPAHFFRQGPSLVQGWLTPGNLGVREVRSPSVQFYVDRETVTLYDVTEQILDTRGVHEGNESPPMHLKERPGVGEELLGQAGEVGRWLHRQGYRGTASTDFLVVDRDEDTEVYVCEINARVTGATYPSMLAHHLRPGGPWIMRNLRFKSPMSGGAVLDGLARSGHLFAPEGSAAGVFPINFNLREDGLVTKGQFLFMAPTLEGGDLLLQRSQADLACVVDRD